MAYLGSTKQFSFELDELQIEVIEGEFASINPWLSVDASTDENDTVTIERVYIQTGQYELERGVFQNNWVRIDDLPEFKNMCDAVQKVAPNFIPQTGE